MPTSTMSKPIHECVSPNKGGSTGWRSKTTISQQSQSIPEPFDRHFYADKDTGELFYLLGTNKHDGLVDYVFDAVLGQRIMSLDLLRQRLVPVEPSDQDYQFRTPSERAFYEAHAQSSPKVSEPKNKPVPDLAAELLNSINQRRHPGEPMRTSFYCPSRCPAFQDIP